jgi:hypothetical protein
MGLEKASGWKKSLRNEAKAWRQLTMLRFFISFTFQATIAAQSLAASRRPRTLLAVPRPIAACTAIEGLRAMAWETQAASKYQASCGCTANGLIDQIYPISQAVPGGLEVPSRLRLYRKGPEHDRLPIHRSIVCGAGWFSSR